MKVLFVDDEPQVLHGIQRALYRLSDQWIIATAGSGKEALAELAREPYDAIVTDMRMPEMDGAALLQEVEKRYPRMVRIVLSGYTELEATLRTVPVAHQFLTKPCSPEVIEEVVERAFSLQALLADEAVRDVVGRIETLPSVPHIYSELTKALADPASDVDTVADILAQDPAMSAKVLQLVNSAFFFRGTQCSDVRHAVMRLGFTMIKNLALSVEVFRTPVSLSTAPGFSIEALQQHSLRTASLAGQLLPDKRQSEDAFMAGMLHDIGKLIQAASMPEEFSRIWGEARATGRTLHEVELETLGVSHAEIGGYLLGLWGLPYPIVEAVTNHHDPGRVPRRTSAGVLEAVWAANRLVQGKEVDGAAAAELGVEDRLDSWNQAAAEAAEGWVS